MQSQKILKILENPRIIDLFQTINEPKLKLQDFVAKQIKNTKGELPAFMGVNGIAQLIHSYES